MFRKSPPPVHKWDTEEFRVAMARDQGAWYARRDAAHGRLEAEPRPPYRIARNTAAGTWSVQRSYVSAPNYPPSAPDVQSDYVGWVKIQWDKGAYPSNGFPKLEALDWRSEPEVKIAWGRIGPEDFPTFCEAEHWLAAWIKPTGEAIYFDANGARVDATES